MIRDAWEALSRALAVVRRGTLDREFDEEFATHLELLTEQNERRGLPRPEARRQAILQMGGLNPTRDVHREARGLPRVERFLEGLHAVGKDFRHAARSLARARAFTLVCVISLGVGMGSFVALVTFVRGLTAPAQGIDTTGLVELLVRPLGPLRAKAGVGAIEEWSYPDFQELRQAADIGLAVTGWTMGSTEVGIPVPDGFDFEVGNFDPARVRTIYASANYFRTFGVTLARGPGFDPAVDDRPSAAPRVVVSDGFWRNRLGSDPDIVGKTLTLDSVPHAVVGIAPAGFRGHVSSHSRSAVHAAGATSPAPRRSGPSLQPNCRLAEHPRPAGARRRPRARQRDGVGDDVRPIASCTRQRTNSNQPRSSRTSRRVPPTARRQDARLA